MEFSASHIRNIKDKDQFKNIIKKYNFDMFRKNPVCKLMLICISTRKRVYEHVNVFMYMYYQPVVNMKLYYTQLPANLF